MFEINEVRLFALPPTWICPVSGGNGVNVRPVEWRRWTGSQWEPIYDVVQMPLTVR